MTKTLKILSLGSIVATPGSLQVLGEAGISPVELPSRHARGDWGDLSAHDRKVNREAIRLGYRVLSSYTLSTSERIGIITEASREVTTILLPDEY